MRSVVLILLVACGSSTKNQPAWPADGCLTYVDEHGTLHESDHARCAEPRRPYSTFKIANALIAVDAGVLAGPDAPMTWDQTRVLDDKDWPDVWRKPHTLRSGIAVSAVPYFRTLALQLGEERMRAGLAKLAYGNQDMSGDLDRFWLRGKLRISGAQQLALVDALAHRTLAVSRQAQDVVAEVTILSTTADRVIHGKTGTGPNEDGRKGWIVWQVGWIERGGKIIPYAAWLETPDESMEGARAARAARLDPILSRL